MEELRKQVGCVAIASGVAIVLALFLKEFASQIDSRTCLIIFLPLVFGMVWFLYRSAFIPETYSDEEKRIVLQQLWALMAFILVSFLLLMATLWPLANIVPISYLILSSLLAYVGLSAMKNRISLIKFKGASNKGGSAFVMGLIFTGAAGVLFISCIKFILGR